MKVPQQPLKGRCNYPASLGAVMMAVLRKHNNRLMWNSDGADEAHMTVQLTMHSLESDDIC